MFSFYHGTGKPEGIGFLKTFKNPIYYKIILVIIPVIII